MIKQHYRKAEKKGYGSIQREREPVKFRQMPGGGCDLVEKGGNHWVGALELDSGQADQKLK